jgi:hypothetical protein
MNMSYHIVRVLPHQIGQLAVLYLAYIRSFCNLLFNQLSTKPDMEDGDYILCSEESTDKSWDGAQLTSILKRESEKRMGVELGLSLYRHFAIAVTRVHVKEVAAHFAKDDEGVEKMLSLNRDFTIYAWQGGHSHGTNTARYGLDAAYPGRLQPELLSEYHRISVSWHRFLDLIDHAREDGNEETAQRGV